MKLKIFSLVLIAILAISVIGSVSAVDIDVHIQKSGSPGLGKTWTYDSGAYSYTFNNLWLLAWSPLVTLNEATICRNESDLNNYVIHWDWNGSAYHHTFGSSSVQDQLIHLDNSKNYVLYVNGVLGDVKYYINSSAVRDSTIPLVLDGTTARTDIHLGVNGVKYDNKMDSSDFIETTPVPKV